MRTVLLLIGSNVFMNFAWYGHLKFRSHSLLVVVLVSWLIALPEYALQVPANRLGFGQFTSAQLKIMQEAISISVFLLLNRYYLQAVTHWNEWLAFGLIIAAVVCMQLPQLLGQTPPSAITAGEH
ncbi:MAG: DMT family protein [Planctomycetaceae bacterium]|nr:DMT family protein [Planctomycetaceae bacterium]